MKPGLKNHPNTILSGLEKEHSKKQTHRIARIAIESKAGLSELMNLYFGNEKIIAQRAAWVLSVLAKNHPGLLDPYLKKIVLHLRKENLHDAIKRNGIKVLELSVIPKSLKGLVADLCFNFLSNNNEAVAIRCYAMTVLSKICQAEPGLKDELRLVIEAALPYSKSGFRSRAMRTLKELKTPDGVSKPPTR
jgi:hypothetical protein